MTKDKLNWNRNGYRTLDFMLIGLPRSGTTWAANWLTTTDVFCLHDPLYKLHYSDFDTDRTYFPHPMLYNNIGISCTAIWRFPEYVNAHPARKIVVIRDFDEVQKSLEECNLPLLDDDAIYQLEKIDAPRVRYEDLFKTGSAESIWRALVGSGHNFCPLRHKALCEMHIDPFFSKVVQNFEAIQKLYNELNQR